jgi:hypothetical protein
VSTAVHGFPPKDHYRSLSPSINKGFFAGRNGLGDSRTRAWHGKNHPFAVAFPGFTPRLAVFTPCNAVVNQLLLVSRR